MQPIKEFINNPMKKKFCEKDNRNSLALGVIMPAILVKLLAIPKATPLISVGYDSEV